MKRILTLTVVLCAVAAACGSSSTPTMTVEPRVEPGVDQPPTVRSDGPEVDEPEPIVEQTPTDPPEMPVVTTPEPVVEQTPVTVAPLELTADRLPADPQAPAGEWVAGINAAGWDFHRQLDGNAVSSPLSSGLAFSLARAGASPDTAMALDTIFGFPIGDLHGAANTVDLALYEASREPNILEIANRLFSDDGFVMQPDFLDLATKHYGAGVQPLDFADPDTAAAVINDWVAERTRGLIPEIASPAAVQRQELILANTVYLKADWDKPFLAEITSGGSFHTTDDQTVTVPFMRDDEPEQRRYVRLRDADAVELPYEGGDLSMWLIIPQEVDGLAAVEESLNAETVAGLSDVAQTGLVELEMPKWEQTLPPTDLFDWLCPQGFCVGARFDGIAPGLFATAALHSAKVIVDEKGTEAAAVTSMDFPMSGPPEPDLRIVADRPFLWAIIHQDTGSILFVGRLLDPTGW